MWQQLIFATSENSNHRDFLMSKYFIEQKDFWVSCLRKYTVFSHCKNTKTKKINGDHYFQKKQIGGKTTKSCTSIYDVADFLFSRYT